MLLLYRPRARRYQRQFFALHPIPLPSFQARFLDVRRQRREPVERSIARSASKLTAIAGMAPMPSLSWLGGRTSRSRRVAVRCYREAMQAAWSNIEAVAREICERQLLSVGTPPDEIPSAVDRYRHCVAAEIEAGIIDENGNTLRPFNSEQGLEAYRDWRRRHSTYRVPPPRSGGHRY